MHFSFRDTCPKCKMTSGLGKVAVCVNHPPHAWVHAGASIPENLPSFNTTQVIVPAACAQQRNNKRQAKHAVLNLLSRSRGEMPCCPSQRRPSRPQSRHRPGGILQKPTSFGLDWGGGTLRQQFSSLHPASLSAVGVLGNHGRFPNAFQAQGTSGHNSSRLTTQNVATTKCDPGAGPGKMESKRLDSPPECPAILMRTGHCPHARSIHRRPFKCRNIWDYPGR